MKKSTSWYLQAVLYTGAVILVIILILGALLSSCNSPASNPPLYNQVRIVHDTVEVTIPHWDTVKVQIIDTVVKTIGGKDTLTIHDTVKLPAPLTIIAPMPPPGLADYSLYFQKGWDSAISIGAIQYILPLGRFPMAHPLIGQQTFSGQYKFWTCNLIGQGTAGESDGNGTILDWSLHPEVAFGIGLQCAKGEIIKGIKCWGAFKFPVPNAQAFYNAELKDIPLNGCKNTGNGPESGIVIDPFGPNLPANGTGFTGTDAYGKDLSTYYRGNRNGSTGVHVTEVCLTNWVVGGITSPNGVTQNADNLTFDFIRVGDCLINFAGCQDQEKNNTIAHIQSWGVSFICFATGMYGAASIGQWNLSYWNIAGYTHEIIFNNQSGYYPTYLDHIYAESIKRLGTINSTNGTTLRDCSIGFAGPDEAGSYTPDMIAGGGFTIDGGQYRVYGWPLPVTIKTGYSTNDVHIRDAAFEGGVPIYPQTYYYGNTDFSNVYVGGESSAIRLNPLGPNPKSPYQYPTESNVAAINAFLCTGKFKKGGTNTFTTDSLIDLTDVVTVTKDFITYIAAGKVTVINDKDFTVSYTTPEIDSTSTYYIYKWKTLKK